MALLPITPKSGVYTNGTDYQNRGRWITSNLIRFKDGILVPIKGWDLLRSTALTGIPIGIFSYNKNDGDQILVIGTDQKVYTLYNFVWRDITPSGFVTPDSTSPLGYGAFNYNVEDYGDARSESGLGLNAHSYSFDNWGEHLIFSCSSDGKLYQWRPDAGSGSPDATATAITNAPTGCQSLVVSNERHLVAIGSSSDPRKVSWSSREANTTWTAASTNTAGDLQIPTGGRALTALKWQTDILVWTDTGLARLYYTGSPFIYGISDAGTNCKAISPRAIASAGNFIAWLGESSVFIYDGSVQELKCPVSSYIFDNINYLYRKATCAGHNSSNNEIWFFFPSGESKTPDKYVLWNYIDNTWAIGELNRSAYHDAGVFDYPIASDENGFVYYQEKGSLFNSKDLGTSKPTATSGAIQLAKGDNYIHATQVIPDSEATTLPGVTLSFKGRFTPLGAQTDFGSVTFENDGYSDCRISAREISMTIEGDTDQSFSLGDIRLDLKNGGRR